jgi:hypothetical protein
MLQKVYGKVVVKKTRVYGWHKRFHDGSASVNDDPGYGRPTTSTNDESIKRVRIVVPNDRWKSN